MAVPREETAGYGEDVAWEPAVPRIGLVRLIVSWATAALSLYVAAGLVPGLALQGAGAAFAGALVIGLVNAVLPPLIAALRLPFTLAVGFLLVLFVDAAALSLAGDAIPGLITVDDFPSALLGALVMSAVTIVIAIIAGTNDDDEYSLRVVRRIARRGGGQTESDRPGLLMLEIDGLGLPILQHAMRNGSAPNMARWLAEDGYELREWETDLSSQTGASQAGILLGSNEDIPAFRWVEKESGTMMTCSNPADCAEIERRHANGRGILLDGGSSRGNLLSGEAEETILTVSRIEAEKKSNPGYRAFLANGFNVTRSFVLFVVEVVIEWVAAARAIRRDVRPRGHRGGYYPFLRGALCVVVRDLIVFGVLSDMMRGRPAVYATFSSYDEVAHHSGLERADTMEALRKLDQQFGRIMAARRFAPRPYEVVVLSDHGQTQGATFKQRNGFGLEDLVERSLGGKVSVGFAAGDEQDAIVGHAVKRGERGRGQARKAAGQRRQRSRYRRARLRQPRSDLSDGGEAALDDGGDRRAPPGAARRAALPSARRLAARALERPRRCRARPGGDALAGRGPDRGPRPARALLGDRRAAPEAH